MRFAQPTDVRAPVSRGERRCLTGLFLGELRDPGGYAAPSSTRNVYLCDTVVRAAHRERGMRKRGGETASRPRRRRCWRPDSRGQPIPHEEDKVGLPVLLHRGVEG